MPLITGRHCDRLDQLVQSLISNRAQQIMHCTVLEQQIRVQNPAVPNYTYLKYWFGSVEKVVSESVYQDVSCGFHLLEDIIW